MTCLTISLTPTHGIENFNIYLNELSLSAGYNDDRNYDTLIIFSLELAVIIPPLENCCYFNVVDIVNVFFRECEWCTFQWKGCPTETHPEIFQLCISVSLLWPFSISLSLSLSLPLLILYLFLIPLALSSSTLSHFSSFSPSSLSLFLSLLWFHSNNADPLLYFYINIHIHIHKLTCICKH